MRRLRYRSRPAPPLPAPATGELPMRSSSLTFTFVAVAALALAACTEPMTPQARSTTAPQFAAAVVERACGVMFPGCGDHSPT